MSIERDIWLALKSRVEEIPSSLGLNMQIAWPAEFFAVDNQYSYLRVSYLTSDPVRQFIADGQPHERTGTLPIVTVRRISQSSEPMSGHQDLAGKIAAHFRDGTAMNHGNICVTVPRYPTVSSGYEDSGYWCTPIAIPWRCYA